jgi:hypothetical protein
MDYARKKQISTLARSLVIVTGLLAMLFVGSASIGIAISREDVDTDTQPVKTGQCYISTFKLADDDGSMNKNEKSGSENSIFFIIQAVISGQNFDNIRPNLKLIESRTYHDFNLNPIHILTTAASISPEKAVEFTLVGAKPSGTS